MKKNPQLILQHKDAIIHDARLVRARASFLEYRLLINPKLKVGWFVREAAKHLQEFAEDFIAGKRPILILQAPPQHGKSAMVIDFISWMAGCYPELQTIFASFSDRLGVRANLKLQRIYDSEIYKQIFPDLILASASDKKYSRNRKLLEYMGAGGSFRNTTVNGSVTGESLDLGFIDDPIKGRSEANSEVIRDKAWDWFSDDFFTRFSELAGLLMVLTRWHLDDPAGRLIEIGLDNIKVLRYEAIATKDEIYRRAGEALFPALKSLEFLLQRRKVLGIANFEALYQQNPIVMGGDIFKEENFQYFKTPRRYKRIVLSWDTAYKPGEFNDPSVCGVWGEHEYGYDLLHVYRERVAYPKLKKDAIRLANEWINKKHLFAAHILFSILIEDKGSGQSLIQDLRNETKFNIFAIEPEGDKITRAHVCTPQFEAGKVFLLYGATWLEDYKKELLAFPNAIHDDQVDMTSQFLNSITTPLSGTITDILLEAADYSHPENPW